MHFLITTISLTLLSLELSEKIKCDDVMTKNFYDGDSEPLQAERMKKPFCNAFTGCGRKRADDSLGSLLDFNVESGMENLNRQIPMNVRLWMALQNARSSKKSNDWTPLRQLERQFYNYRRKRCELDGYPC